MTLCSLSAEEMSKIQQECEIKKIEQECSWRVDRQVRRLLRRELKARVRSRVA